MAKIQAYSKKELATLYGVTVKTFESWIKPFAHTLGELNGKRFTPKQTQIIFDKLGTPQ